MKKENIYFYIETLEIMLQYFLHEYSEIFEALIDFLYFLNANRTSFVFRIELIVRLDKAILCET